MKTLALFGFAAGEPVQVWRGTYWHHGVVKSPCSVIVLRNGKGRCRESHQEFSKGGRVQRSDFGTAKFSRRQILARARGEGLNKETYSLLFNNCEHFARWCVTGERNSYQVARATVSAGAGLIAGRAIGNAWVGIAVGVGSYFLLQMLSTSPAEESVLPTETVPI
jgi:hypothetical protein